MTTTPRSGGPSTAGAESLPYGRPAYVFTDSLGRPLSQEQLAKRMWNPTIEAIGLSSRGQCNARATFITLALSAGEGKLRPGS